MLTTMLKPFSFAKSLVPSLACFACGVLLEMGFGLTGKLRRGNVMKKRRLLAVSGTLQDGFALRKNLDGPGEEDKAVFIVRARSRREDVFRRETRRVPRTRPERL